MTLAVALICGITALNIVVLLGVLYLVRTNLNERLVRAERFLLVVEQELFQDGAYPEQGLRAWARVWRGRLRQDVAIVQGRLDSLEHKLYDEWQAEKHRRIMAEFHAPPRDN